MVHKGFPQGIFIGFLWISMGYIHKYTYNVLLLLRSLYVSFGSTLQSHHTSFSHIHFPIFSRAWCFFFLLFLETARSMGPMGGGDFHSWGITRIVVFFHGKRLENPNLTWMMQGGTPMTWETSTSQTIAARPADRGDRGLRCWSASRIGLAPTRAKFLGRTQGV